jgi:hypothetical protein
MSKKTFTLVTALIGGCGTIASAIVTYLQPAWASAIVAGIGIAVTAVTEILTLFTKSDK